MVTTAQKHEIARHKAIAKRALEQLSALEIKSWNKPWNSDKANRRANLIQQRQDNNPQYFNDFAGYSGVIAQTKLGNC
jgi:hypothetical protein